MFTLVKVSCIANQAGSSWADTNIQQLVFAGIVFVLAILFMAAKSQRQKAAGVCLLFSGVMAGSLPIINLNIDFACGDHLTTAHLTEALPYLNGFALLMLVTCGVGAIASALKYFKLVRTELNTVRGKS